MGGEGVGDPNMTDSTKEAERIVARYRRRDDGGRYRFTNPEVWQGIHERQRRIVRLIRRLGWNDLSDKTLLDVGCGDGGSMLDFIRMGFHPEHVIGIELLPERVARARQRLPKSVAILSGDALKTDIHDASFDIVFQSVVFSSILDAEVQQQLAEKMWKWAKPGGGVLWYDFTYNNPKNPDVRGIPAKRVRKLFPKGKFLAKRITLAPPVSRVVCRVHPHAYHVFNTFLFLRTHLLAWIEKS